MADDQNREQRVQGIADGARTKLVLAERVVDAEEALDDQYKQTDSYKRKRNRWRISAFVLLIPFVVLLAAAAWWFGILSGDQREEIWSTVFDGPAAEEVVVPEEEVSEESDPPAESSEELEEGEEEDSADSEETPAADTDAEENVPACLVYAPIPRDPPERTSEPGTTQSSADDDCCRCFKLTDTELKCL